MKTPFRIILATLTLGLASLNAQVQQDEDRDPCDNIAEQAAQQAVANLEEILTIVSTMSAENQDCADEIVAAVITETNASNSLVGQIVEVAATAAPGQINLIANAAYVAAPQALTQINAAGLKFPGFIVITDVVGGGGDILALIAPELPLGGNFSNGLFPGSVNQGEEEEFVTDPNPGQSQP